MGKITKCWNCHKNTMKLAPKVGAGWYKCLECGATDYPNPVSLGASDFGMEKNVVLNVMQRRPRKRQLSRAVDKRKETT